MSDETQITRPADHRNQIVDASGAPALLDRIRATWKARSLIERVQRLLPVDAGSACQRLFNAAVQDLREKIVTAGIDIAQDDWSGEELRP